MWYDEVLSVSGIEVTEGRDETLQPVGSGQDRTVLPDG